MNALPQPSKVIATAMFLCWSHSATAEAARCSLNDTQAECLQRYADSVDAAATTAAQHVEVEKLKAKEKGAAANFGNANSSSNSPSSSFTDFFNTMQSNVSSGAGGSTDPESFAFELNHCGFPRVAGQTVACQIRGRLETPALYAPLQKALDQAQLNPVAKELQDGLAITDHISSGIFLSATNEYFGSGLTSANNTIFQELQDEAAASIAINNIDLSAATMQFTRYLSDLGTHRPELQTEIAQAVNATGDGTFLRFPAAVRDEVLANFETFAVVATQRAQARAAALERVGYFELANLLNNQPQLFAGVEYRYASEFAGPSEVRAKISYEMGFANINLYRRYAKKNCKPSSDNVSTASDCLHSYFESPGVRAALAGGDRLAISLEHVRRNRYTVALPGTTVMLEEAATHSWMGSLTLGLYVNALHDTEQKTRIDVTASYEDFSDDPKRQNRGVASATLSRQFTPGWVLAVGLVYATKPEFRDKADKDLSLRLGLNYKLLRQVPH